MSNPPSTTWRDQFEPGWREKEAEMRKKILESIPIRQTAPVQEPTIAACIIGSAAVGKKIDGYEAAKVYAAMQKAMGTPPAAQPAVPLTEKKYRLLDHAEKIESGDEVLDDDSLTWHPLVGWEVGMQWGGHFMMPMRRPIETVNGITEKGQP